MGQVRPCRVNLIFLKPDSCNLFGYFVRNLDGQLVRGACVSFSGDEALARCFGLGCLEGNALQFRRMSLL